MTHALQLGALMPRVVDAQIERPRHGAELPGIAELKALDVADVALPEHLDLEVPTVGGRFFQARSFSDDLRLPAPPRRARSAAALRGRLEHCVAQFRAKLATPVAVGAEALEAEARLMAACEGLCEFQDAIDRKRSEPMGAIDQRIAQRTY
ncbi:MAG: hypothetical protein RMA76_13735 [Deltaproteobacteria bacterium]